MTLLLITHNITNGIAILDIEESKQMNLKQVKCSLPMLNFFSFIFQMDIKLNLIGRNKDGHGLLKIMSRSLSSGS